MLDPLSGALATAVRTARRDRALSVTTLAERSGVSRAMIGKIERGAVQPTAALLGRLSGALGLTLSELVARAEGTTRHRLARAADQPVWTDPQTGYRRRAVSPPVEGPLELVEVELPGGTTVRFPADAHAFLVQQLWVLEGRLRFTEGDVTHDLGPGDCLQLGAAAPTAFASPGGETARYLVALTRRR